MNVSNATALLRRWSLGGPGAGLFLPTLVALAWTLLPGSNTARGQQLEPPSLVGSVWQGTESIYGKPTPLTFWFQANGEVIVAAADNHRKQVTYHGKYSRQGDQIIMDFPTTGFNATFQGTLQFQTTVRDGAAGAGGVPAGWHIQGQGDDHSGLPRWNFKVQCTKVGISQ